MPFCICDDGSAKRVALSQPIYAESFIFGKNMKRERKGQAEIHASWMAM